MKINKFCLAIMSLFLCAINPITVYGQTVVYNYNSQGGCISRKYFEKQQARKMQRKVSNPQKMRVEILPANYFNDQITIIVYGELSDSNVEYIMTKISGQLIYKGIIEQEKFTLKTAFLTNGIYILKINGNNYEEAFKLIKK